MLKALQNSELKVNRTYLGYNIKDGVFIFRYLGQSQWSSGVSVGNFDLGITSKHPYEKNKGNVLVFMEVFFDLSKSLHKQCMDKFGLSKTEMIDAMYEHKEKWFGKGNPIAVSEDKPKTKYKIVNSLEPLYRTA